MSDLTCPTPRQVAERIRLTVLNKTTDPELFADDAVYETPFSLPGAPQRFVGKDEIDAHMKEATSGGAAQALDIHEVHATVHDGADPEVVILELAPEGESLIDGRAFHFASSIGVVRVRNGKIVHWRDYPNIIGGSEAAGALPQLADMLRQSAGTD